METPKYEGIGIMFNLSNEYSEYAVNPAGYCGIGVLVKG